MIVPTFDDRERICATDIRSVERSWESWILRSATSISYGSTKEVDGATTLVDSAAAMVTTLKVEPGS